MAVTNMYASGSFARDKSDMIGVFRLESQMLSGNGKFDRTGLGFLGEEDIVASDIGSRSRYSTGGTEE